MQWTNSIVKWATMAVEPQGKPPKRTTFVCVCEKLLGGEEKGHKNPPLFPVLLTRGGWKGSGNVPVKFTLEQRSCRPLPPSRSPWQSVTWRQKVKGLANKFIFLFFFLEGNFFFFLNSVHYWTIILWRLQCNSSVLEHDDFLFYWLTCVTSFCCR